MADAFKKGGPFAAGGGASFAALAAGGAGDGTTAGPAGPKAGSLGGVMEEMGYACTASEAAFAEVLETYGAPVGEAAVAEVVGMVARTHSGLDDPSGTQASLAAALGAMALADAPNGQSWNVDVIVDVLKKKAPGLDWQKVGGGVAWARLAGGCVLR